MAKPTRRPPEPAYEPKLPERLCPEHGVLMEPVGEYAPPGAAKATGALTAYYYCPTGGAVRAWRDVFKAAA